MAFETFEELREARLRLKRAHEENNFDGLNEVLYKFYIESAFLMIQEYLNFVA